MSSNDIAIVPVGSKLHDKPNRVSPVYLVIVEDLANKNRITKFIATRVDEQTNSIKIVGFASNEDVDFISQNYQELINSADKLIYKEMQLPWQRVISIQNLIFKLK